MPSLGPSRLELRTRNLSPARRRLIILLQRLHFGTIRDLRIHAGEPVFDPPPRIIRRRKNGGSSHPGPISGIDDFVLKREWVEFFDDLDAIGDGVILVIDVAHGQPFVYEFEDVIHV